MIKRKHCIACTAAGGALLLIFEGVKRIWGFDALGVPDNKIIREALEVIFTRGIAGVVFFIMLLYMGYKVVMPQKENLLASLAFSLPAFAVAINNFPLLPLLFDRQTLNYTVTEIILITLECLCIGLFEEMTFRGVVFLGFLERRRKTKTGIFISIMLSSAVFGLIHLFNLIGGGAGAVFMQIGYSFLIGAMCSVILIRTGNIWLCVLIHALFDIGGMLDVAQRWTVESIILTVVVAIIVGAFYVTMFFKTDPKVTDKIFISGENEEKLF